MTGKPFNIASHALAPDPAATKLEAFRFEDIASEGYDPHPGIKAPIAA